MKIRITALILLAIGAWLYVFEKYGVMTVHHNSPEKITRSLVNSIKTQLQLHHSEHGQYPAFTNHQELINSLIDADLWDHSDWAENLNEDGSIDDAWGRPLEIKHENGVILISSLGEDGVPNTKDDIQTELKDGETRNNPQNQRQ